MSPLPHTFFHFAFRFVGLCPVLSCCALTLSPFLALGKARSGARAEQIFPAKCLGGTGSPSAGV